MLVEKPILFDRPQNTRLDHHDQLRIVAKHRLSGGWSIREIAFLMNPMDKKLRQRSGALICDLVGTDIEAMPQLRGAGGKGEQERQDEPREAHARFYNLVRQPT